MRASRSSQTAILTAVLVLAVIHPASAAVDNANILNNVINLYRTASANWAGVIQDAATRLFWSLAVISLVWTFGTMALRKADIGEFFAEFIRFIVFTGFYLWLLTNGPQFASSIMNSMAQLGTQAGGNPSSPSGIVDTGFSIMQQYFDAANACSWTQYGLSVMLFFIGILIVVALALVAINLVLLQVAAWFLAYAGIFYLGFGGSRWTSEFSIGYFKTVVNIGVQLLALILIAALGNTFMQNLTTQMANDTATLQDGVVVLISAMLLVALSLKIPPLLGGIITGVHHAGNIATVGAASVAQFIWSLNRMSDSFVSGSNGSRGGGATSSVREAVSKGTNQQGTKARPPSP
jgi:type IV secretion system protein TrbL